MAKDQYVYAVARIRSKELSLLSGSVIEQLLGAKGYDECLQLLREKNWGDSDAEDAGAILAAEREKTWQLIGELVKDLSVFDVFLRYHHRPGGFKRHLPGGQGRGGRVPEALR